MQRRNVMFIVFGWGHQSRKDFGATLELNCPNCNNDSWWHLSQYKAWFTLFFIPIIPYESKYFMHCNICSSGIEIEKDKLAETKELLCQHA